MLKITGIRKRINSKEQDLRKLAGLAWQGIREQNEPPWLFRAEKTDGTGLVRIDYTGGRLTTWDVNKEHLYFILLAAIDWYVNKPNDEDGFRVILTKPPTDLAAVMLSDIDDRIPHLDKVVRAPTFTRGGHLIEAPGYDLPSSIYHAPPHPFLPVPEDPDSAELEIAKEILMELLCDFPFASLADSANAIAAMLVPIVRPMIDGPTPWHFVLKEHPGAGGTLLASTIAGVSLSSTVSITHPDSESEMARTLSAVLASRPGAVILDNMDRHVDSSSLAYALTARENSSRTMGSSSLFTCPVDCLWLGSGNNTSFSTELTRRVVLIELDCPQIHPCLREGFKHEDLGGWLRESLPSLLQSLHVLVRRWLKDGRPLGRQRMGSYEAYARVIGGILGSANLPGFLDNLRDQLYRLDPDQYTWTLFTEYWWRRHQGREVVASDLIDEAIKAGIVSEYEHDRAKKLGHALYRHRGRIYNNLKVCLGSLALGARRWRLQPLS